jgi:hypothetical protein
LKTLIIPNKSTGIFNKNELIKAPSEGYSPTIKLKLFYFSAEFY